MVIPVTPEQVLACPMGENDADAKTVRDYLGKLLLEVCAMSVSLAHCNRHQLLSAA